MPPPPTGPEKIAVQAHTPRFGPLIALGALLPMAIGGGIAYSTIRRANHAVEEGRAASARVQREIEDRAGAPSWQGGYALVVDVDGNGTLDLVGRSRRVQKGDSVGVMALDGGTGKMLWETETLGTYSETYQGILALDGDQIVFASPRAEVRAFALGTGATKWKAQLDERVQRFCRSEDQLLAVGTDDVVRPLRRADGTAGVAEATPPPAPTSKRKSPKPACPALPTDNQTLQRSFDYDLGRAVGMSTNHLVNGPGGRVLSGTRETGTRVGMLALLDNANKPRWKITVPQDPLGSTEGAPEDVVVGEGEVCASYYAASITEPLRFACFALEDGRRLWDRQLDDKWMRRMQIVETSLVVTGSSISKLELATGKVVWRFGS